MNCGSWSMLRTVDMMCTTQRVSTLFSTLVLLIIAAELG